MIQESISDRSKVDDEMKAKLATVLPALVDGSGLLIKLSFLLLHYSRRDPTLVGLVLKYKCLFFVDSSLF